MNLSHAYATPPPRDMAERVLRTALECGVTMFDTAALYGFGANEELLGAVLKPYRADIVLASKGGMFRDETGRRAIDARPDTLKRMCDDSLMRLQTDVIDLYYLHRKDPNVPIADSIGALADLVHEGKVRTIGLSEVSAATLRQAHAVHPVTAIQSEYSLWTRNPEIAVLDACRELGVTFVAFSPLARGFLCGELRNPEELEVGVAACLGGPGQPHPSARLGGGPAGRTHQPVSRAARSSAARRALDALHHRDRADVDGRAPDSPDRRTH